MQEKDDILADGVQSKGEVAENVSDPTADAEKTSEVETTMFNEQKFPLSDNHRRMVSDLFHH